MYDVLVIDPPWPKKKGGLLRKNKYQLDRNLDYPTMEVYQIFELLKVDILPKANDVHCVFLWNIDEFLVEAEHWFVSMGYKRHARFIWDKLNGVAPGFTVRYSHEYLVWYYKPKLLPIAPAMEGYYTTVFQERGREHSRKPDVSYTIIDNLYPRAKKIDVFSREKRPGWDQYGNQVGYFNDK